MEIDLAQVEEAQKAICQQYAAAYVASPPDSKTGVAMRTAGTLPINGLRHPVVGTSSGWFIWFGERFSDDADFFVPIHTYHLYEDQPKIAKLLGLPPGFRFLFAADFIDIWFDSALLEI